MSQQDQLQRVYELLKTLISTSSNELANELVNQVKSLNLASNTGNVFHFYFPIISHILYYKPALETELLAYLIGPNFANGICEVDEMVSIIQSAMKNKLLEDENYLSEQGQLWVLEFFPKMEKEIHREIEQCWKELD